MRPPQGSAVVVVERVVLAGVMTAAARGTLRPLGPLGQPSDEPSEGAADQDAETVQLPGAVHVTVYVVDCAGLVCTVNVNVNG